MMQKMFSLFFLTLVSIEMSYAKSECYSKNDPNEIEECLMEERHYKEERDRDDKRKDSLVRGLTYNGTSYPDTGDRSTVNYKVSSGLTLFENSEKDGTQLAKEFSFSLESLDCRFYRDSFFDFSCMSGITTSVDLVHSDDGLGIKKIDLLFGNLFNSAEGPTNRNVILEDGEFKLLSFIPFFGEYREFTDSFLPVATAYIGIWAINYHKGKFSSNHQISRFFKLDIRPFAFGGQKFEGNYEVGVFSSIEGDGYKQFNPEMEYLQSIQLGLKIKDIYNIWQSNQLTVSPYIGLILSPDASFNVIGIYDHFNTFHKKNDQILTGKSVKLQFDYRF
jgi:hypothetical protein